MTGRKMTSWCVAAILAALTAFVSIAAPPAKATSGAVSWTSSDVLVGEEDKRENRTEVHVAIDPSDNSRLIAATMDWSYGPPPPGTAGTGGSIGPLSTGYRGSWAVRILSSEDTGATWQDHGFAPMPPIPGISPVCTPAWSADPMVAFDSRGTAYLAYIAYMCKEDGGISFRGGAAAYVVRSTDGGRTWAGPDEIVPVGRWATDNGCGRGFDKEYLTVGGDDALYVSWTGSQVDCGTGQLSRGNSIFFSKSTDGGATWSRPAVVGYGDIAGESSIQERAGNLVVTFNRTTIVPVAELGTRCPNAFSTALAADGTAPFAEIVAARSADGGASWSSTVVAQPCDVDPNTWSYFGSIASYGIDVGDLAWDARSGVITAAWADLLPERSLEAEAPAGIRSPIPAVRTSSSHDGGATWSDPVSVPDVMRGTFLPTLAAADGVVRLTYLAALNTGVYETLYRGSADGGATWSAPTVLNSGPQCVCFSATTGPFWTGQLGHYMALDARDGVVVAAWPSIHHPTEPQDIKARVGTYPM